MSRPTRSLPLLVLAAGLLSISAPLLAQVREIPRLAIPQMQVAPGSGATIYCTFTSEQQGAIVGDRPAPGQPNSIPVSAFSAGISGPFDPGSGLPTGKGQHQPVQIVKAVDRASPHFLRAMTYNENFTAVDCSFYRQPGGQSAQRYFRIRLKNARLVDTQIDSGPDVRQGAQEVLQFVYETILLEDPVGGTSQEASWGAPTT
jgi:type VI secretion system Hcp family effector